QIEAATNTPQKLEILNDVIDSNTPIPTLHDEYGFSIISAFMGHNNTSISITVSIYKNNGNPEARFAIFYINNLKVSTLDIEAAKFASATTITPNTSAIDAAKSINEVSDDLAKLNALGIFANVPTLAEGFGFKVKSARVNGSLETSLDVLITIMETGKPQTARNIVYLVTGLKNSTVIIEAAKFNNPITTSKPDSSTTDLVASITVAPNEEKVNIIKGFANLPSLAYGFELNIVTAIAKVTEIEIHAQINESVTNNTKTFTFVIRGFELSNPDHDIQIEAEKFTPSTPKNSNLYATQAASSINNATDIDKLYALHLIVNVPTLSDGFGIKVNSAIIPNNSNTRVNVSITIFNISNPEINITRIFEIYDFRQVSLVTLETEAAKFNSQITKDSNRVSKHVVEAILIADDAERKEILNSIMDFAPIADGFDFEVNWAIVDRNDARNISITVSVFEIGHNSDIKRTTTFTISGFKASTLEDEALKFGSSITTNNALSSIEALKLINDATSSILKFEALETFANVPTLVEGFYFEVKSANINGNIGTTLDVLITITEKETNNTITILYLVTGLKNSTLDIEAQKFLTANVSTTHRDTNISAEEWATRINLASDHEARLAILEGLLTIYNGAGRPIGNNIPVLSEGFSFQILGANNEDRSVKVDISIIDNTNGNSITTFLTIKAFNKATDTPLEKEVKKYHGKTFASKLISIEDLNSLINNPEIDIVEKLTILNDISDGLPIFNNNFTYNIELARDISPTEFLIIFKIVDGLEVSPANITITGFATRLEAQKSALESISTTKSTDFTSQEAMESINSKNDPLEKLKALKVLVDIPTLYRWEDYIILDDSNNLEYPFDFVISQVNINSDVNTSI
ncbi:MAG: hypothetical protein ACRCXE_02515, partial [Metamycoplasmataceae bacterium]